jgi:hypothetical protein
LTRRHQLLAAVATAALSGCPSLGPVRIACGSDADCPSGVCAADSFCTQSGSGGGTANGGGVGAGGGSAGAGGGDAGHRRFCDSLDAGHLFCEDFDEPDADVDFTHWSYVSTDDAGRVVLDSSQANSPPRSMLAYMNPRPGSCYFTHADYSATTTARRGHAELSVRLGSGYSGVFGTISFSTNNVGACQLALWQSDDPTGHFDGGVFGLLDQALPWGQNATYSDSFFSSSPIRHDTWVRVGLDYDIAHRTLALSIDGTVVLDGGLQDTCPYPNPDSVALTAGLLCVDQPAAVYRVWYDDIVFDTE